jgi:hypothetical protein
MSTETNPTTCFSLIELKFDLQGRITNWDDVRDYYLMKNPLYRNLYEKIYISSAYKDYVDRDRIMIYYLLEYIRRLEMEEGKPTGN